MAKMSKKVKEQQVNKMTNDLFILLQKFTIKEEDCKDIANKLINEGWENAYSYNYCYIVTASEYKVCLNYLEKNNYNIPEAWRLNLDE